jgi:hypothetical protein
MSKDIDSKFAEAKLIIFQHISKQTASLAKDKLLAYHALFSASSINIKTAYCALLGFAALRIKDEVDREAYNAASLEFRKVCTPLFDTVSSFQEQMNDYSREFKSAPGC